MANEGVSGKTVIITDPLAFSDVFSSYYLNQTLADVDIILNGQKICSHRIILAARSKYFKTLLCTKPPQTKIFIKDASPAVFRKVLQYIYIGYITLDTSDIDTIFELIELAGRYELKSLEVAISTKLTTFINTENVFDILNKATLHDIAELKNSCLSFMDDNSAKILKSDYLVNLTQKSIISLLERDSFMVPEIDIFKFVAKWCRVNNDANNLVMQTVRLNCLTAEEILSVVRPSKLVEESKLLNVLEEIINGTSKAAKPRIPIYKHYENQNLCNRKFRPEFTSGNGTDILLRAIQIPDVTGVTGRNSQWKLTMKVCQSLMSNNVRGYAFHFVDHKDGITLKFETLYYVNHVSMTLWNTEKNYYSYYIEVSQDEKNWHRVIDYTSYRCRSVQKLYFEKQILKYIRVVGTSSSSLHDGFLGDDKEFRLQSLEIYLKNDIPHPQMLNGIICPEQNVATVEYGAVLILSGNGQYGHELMYYNDRYDQEQCYLVIQLAQPYIISNINILADQLCRNNFKIKTSIDNFTWDNAVDYQHDMYSNTVLHNRSFRFKARPTIFIKLIKKGRGYNNNSYYTSNNANYLKLESFECYWTAD